MPENKHPLSSPSCKSITPEPEVKSHEESYSGIGASKGISIGECYVFVKEKDDHDIRELNEKNISEEIEKFLTALVRSEKELKKRYMQRKCPL